MKRRKFLMAGLASAASPMVFAKSKMLRKNKNNPKNPPIRNDKTIIKICKIK